LLKLPLTSSIQSPGEYYYATAEALFRALRRERGGSGDDFSCALRIDGTVTCWGSNGNGRLGNGGNFSSSTPVLVKDLTDASHLTAGDDHACAVRKSGGVSCWGYNENGQLGDGSTVNSSRPVAVAGLTGVTAFSAGVGIFFGLFPAFRASRLEAG
jgi:alpha-tubulin suppressor-like RCC1 family protein